MAAAMRSPLHSGVNPSVFTGRALQGGRAAGLGIRIGAARNKAQQARATEESASTACVKRSRRCPLSLHPHGAAALTAGWSLN